MMCQYLSYNSGKAGKTERWQQEELVSLHESYTETALLYPRKNDIVVIKVTHSGAIHNHIRNKNFYRFL